MTSVSVVTVVRDAMPHVRDALQSLQHQTFRDYQHVVIDACSSDGTTEVVRSYDPSVHVVESDEGLYDALNKGLAYSDRDVVGVLHGDDFYAHHSVLEMVVERFEAEPELDILLTDVAFIDAGGRLTRRYRSGRFRPERLGWGWMPAHTGMYVRRNVFDKVGVYRTDYEIAADFEWVARTFSRFDVSWTHIDDVTMLMRSGGRSTRGWGSRLVLNREVMRACQEVGIPTNYARILSKYPTKVLDKVWRP